MIYALPCDSDGIVDHPLDRLLRVGYKSPAEQRIVQRRAFLLPFLGDLLRCWTFFWPLSLHFLDQGQQEVHVFVFLKARQYQLGFKRLMVAHISKFPGEDIA